LETVRHLVDVGGGRGALVAAVLHAHPATEGVVFDLPHARDGASAFLDKEGLSDRARFVAGDFFAEVPAGGDAYVLKSVLHDWVTRSASSSSLDAALRWHRPGGSSSSSACSQKTVRTV
jgi:hypothetical protein